MQRGCVVKLKNSKFKMRDTRKLIKTLKTTEALGPDEIRARLLKEIAWSISPV
jgi:hypothetical protein